MKLLPVFQLGTQKNAASVAPRRGSRVVEVSLRFIRPVVPALSTRGPGEGVAFSLHGAACFLVFHHRQTNELWVMSSSPSLQVVASY